MQIGTIVGHTQNPITNMNIIRKQKFTWRYFFIGCSLGLITLTVQNRDLLPRTALVQHVQEATSSAFTKPIGPGFGNHGEDDYFEPTPMYDYEQDFIKTCYAHSQNKAYCDCTVDLLKGDPVWNDGKASYLYDELKEQLATVCMIDS